jgi:proline iminopeptidase
MLFPDCWDEFINFLPEEERSDHIGNYHKRLMSSDPSISHPAATAWNKWELSISTLYVITISELHRRHALTLYAKP